MRVNEPTKRLDDLYFFWEKEKIIIGLIGSGFSFLSSQLSVIPFIVTVTVDCKEKAMKADSKHTSQAWIILVVNR